MGKIGVLKAHLDSVPLLGEHAVLGQVGRESNQ